MTPGASRSTGSACAVTICPLSSIGSPSASTTRPIIPSPTGTDMMVPVRFTSSPSLICGVVAQQHGAHLGLVQVHGQSGHAVGELDQLARHHLVQPMHARNAVAQRDHRADLIHLDALLVVLNLLAEQRGYLVRVDLCHVFPALNPALSLSPDFILKSCVSNPVTYAFTSFCLSCCNWPRTDPS